MRARFVRVWRDRSAGAFRVIKQGIKNKWDGRLVADTRR
jgi:hypothetical protein